MTAGATFCKLPLEVINSYENKSVHLALTLSVSRKLFSDGIITIRTTKMLNSSTLQRNLFSLSLHSNVNRKMESVGSSEMNLLTGKSERKKTSLPSSRSKSRQLRRSLAAVDNDEYSVTNNLSAAALGVIIAASFISFSSSSSSKFI